MSVQRFFERNNLVYYIQNIFLDILPRFLFRRKLKYWMKQQSNYPKALIASRVDYYCKTLKNTAVSDGAIPLKHIRKKGHKSMYYYDFMKIARYFKGNDKVAYLFGDVDKNLDEPTMVKSRPIYGSENSVVLKLDRLRHFNFIKDKKTFQEKKDAIVWRGVIHKKNRSLLFENCFGKPNIDIGASTTQKSKEDWIKPFLSIKEQLNFKFILSIEGIDVATNLKWIMSSNSLCFMPKPKFETWFMEGKLIANYHYVLVKDDYSDLEEKMEFFSKNHEDAEKIITNANRWIKQFEDKKLEKILSLLTFQKYLKMQAN